MVEKTSQALNDDRTPLAVAGRDQAAGKGGTPRHAPAPPAPRRPDAATRRISRRSFIGGLGTALAGSAVAACTPRRQPGLGPHGSDTVQLVYQDWRTDWFPGLAKEMLATFHEQHPNIHVFYAPDPDDVDTRMLVDMEAGTAPDVMQGCCDLLPLWGQKNYLLDLRPYVQADLDSSTINDWDSAQYRALFGFDGAQYALPKYHGALALYYNKDLFDRKNTPYPDNSWTHDDYLTAMKRLTNERHRGDESDVWGSMVDISWERIQVHVNGWGGHFVDPQNPRHSRMADPEALTAMRWIRDRIWQDRTMAGPLDVHNVETRDAFINQRIAMVEDGSWALKDILEKARFRVGVAAFPEGPARRVTLATTDGFAIYRHTKYPDAAWQLLKFLVSSDYGRAMARVHLLQPARASLVEEWVRMIREQYPQQAGDMDIMAFADGHIHGYSVTAEVFPNMAAARDLTRSAWEEIYVLGRAPVELMKDRSAQIEVAQAGQPALASPAVQR
jgi:multiple sugar transport system substrate-binding protein